jgi:signal transduction histidine kinase
MSSAAQSRREAAGDREEAADDRRLAAKGRGAAHADRMESAAAAGRALETLESMSEAFFMLDAEWRFTYLNPQTEPFLTVSRDDLLGVTVWDGFPNVVGTRFEDEYRRAVRDQVPVRFEETVGAADLTVQVRAFPVTTGLAVYFSDVTEERRRDLRIQQTERLEMLGQLTAGVAHDFNNFLAVIRGYATLGQDAAEGTKVSKYFGEIDSASQKAVALTRQLLAFAREQELLPTVIDLNDVVEGVSSLLRNILPNDVELRLALAALPVAVFVDQSQLEQVVINLVVNARDAIEGAGTITIRTSSDRPTGALVEPTAEMAWLQVIDSGAGIPDEIRPRIFEPFFSTKARETGTGLGLATIYGIVSHSGGYIDVESAPGNGTTMTVGLPSSRADPG